MNNSFDREKIVECMFDPTTSSILAQLEDGQKECSFLAEQSSVSESEVLERLSYLIEYGFISKNSDGGKCMLTANSEKLTSIVEDGDNFDATISGLEKMDSYLNWFFLFLIPIIPIVANPIIPMMRMPKEIIDRINFLSASGRGPIAPAT